MKIRIKGNSIRLRLTKIEVKTFCDTGYFAEKTVFNTNIFTYELKTAKGVSNFDADFKDGTITVFVPFSECDSWDKNDKVGFKHTLTLSSGQKLSLLIEKDFACLDEREEDQSDNYPNPKMQ